MHRRSSAIASYSARRPVGLGPGRVVSNPMQDLHRMRSPLIPVWASPNLNIICKSDTNIMPRLPMQITLAIHIDVAVARNESARNPFIRIVLCEVRRCPPLYVASSWTFKSLNRTWGHQPQLSDKSHQPDNESPSHQEACPCHTLHLRGAFNPSGYRFCRLPSDFAAWPRV